MNAADREVAEGEDHRHRGPRMSVEMSFNNIVPKFTHSDYFAHYQIFRVEDQTGLNCIACGTYRVFLQSFPLCRRSWQSNKWNVWNYSSFCG